MGKTASEVREGDLKKKFANEMEPMTLNHYFLDTYNKIRLESIQAEFDAILGCVEDEEDSGYKEDYIKKDSARMALVEAFTKINSIGKSNAEQVICINPNR